MHPFGKEPNQQNLQHHCACIRSNPFVSVIVRFLSRAHQDNFIFHPRSPVYDGFARDPLTTFENHTHLLQGFNNLNNTI